MSAPLLWIFLPMAVAVGLWYLNRRSVLTAALAAGLCLFLSMFAFMVPIATRMQVFGLTVEIGSTLSILGRRFELGAADHTFLALIYLVGAFWFMGAVFFKPHRFFAPLGLVIISLLIASMAVEPFLYAALLVEAAVLFSIPILVKPGAPVRQGVLRFLIFQTLAMPFMLLAGWASTAVEANPTDQRLLIEAMALFALGVAFWLAIFPFYNWTPLLAEQAPPFAVGFVFTMIPTTVILMVLEFLNRFAWMREFPMLGEGLTWLGVIMVVTAGIWAAFQQNLARMFAYGLIFENGFALLALSLNQQSGYEILAASLLGRWAALGLWSLAMESLNSQRGLDFDSLRGVIYRHPVAAISAVLACFSIAGLPLLASYPARQVLLESVAARSLVAGLWVLVGVAGMFIGGVRVISTMIAGEDREWHFPEKLSHILLLGLGVVFLFFVGLLPTFSLPVFTNLLRAFDSLF